MSFAVPVALLATACLSWLLLVCRPWPARLASVLVALGGALTLVAGCLSSAAPWASASWRVDPLSGWFLALVGVATVALAPYLPGYLAHERSRTFWPSLGLLLSSMVAVILSANVLVFLVAWEAMSLSSFALVATNSDDRANRRAALVYLGATRAGTAALMAGFLWAHASTGSWTFAEWHLSGAAALGPGLLVLVGLGVKVGLWPFHLWLPIAHPAAPAPVSALMSGVMVKVAVYAIVRLLVVEPAFAHPALGGVLLALGAVSAFWGVLLALLQSDLKRLLAYSTIENVGLIVLGLGLAVVGKQADLPGLARVALAGALLHAFNHALMKSLLFLGAGAVDHATGTRDLEQLGGLGRAMPVTMACFVLGSAAVCAAPPLNGFAGEWLLYQAALSLATEAPSALGRFGAMLLLGWVALVGALALAVFVKAVGVTFLGRPRGVAAQDAVEVSRGMRLAQVVLAAGCVLSACCTPLLLSALHPVVQPLSPSAPGLTAAWSLPLGQMTAVLLLTIGGLALWLKQAAVRLPTREYITWECGFGDLSPRMQVSAGSFGQPVLRLFGVLLRYGATRRADGAQVTVVPRSEPLLERRVYRPLLGLIDHAGSLVSRMQTGSIHAYLSAMAAVLLVLLALERWLP